MTTQPPSPLWTIHPTSLWGQVWDFISDSYVLFVDVLKAPPDVKDKIESLIVPWMYASMHGRMDAKMHGCMDACVR